MTSIENKINELIESFFEETHNITFEAKQQRKERDRARKEGDDETANFRDNVARLIVTKKKNFNQTMGTTPKEIIKELHKKPRQVNTENLLAKNKGIK